MVNKKSGKLLCNKHRIQMDRHGKIIERTTRDPNEIVIYSDYAEIILCDTWSNEKSRAIIDIEDIPVVSQHRWNMEGDGYVSSGRGKNKVRLHRLVMGNPEGLVVDHKEQNLLDNRKSMLRIVTKAQNNINKGKSSRNTSGYTGVSKIKGRETWEAFIQINGKKVTIGYYGDIDDAVVARNKASDYHYGEFAYKGAVV